MAFLEGVEQQRQNKVIDKLLTSQIKTSDQKVKQKQIARQKLRKAVQVASAEWRSEQEGLLSNYSRSQLLSIYIPTAGRKSKGKALSPAERATGKKASEVRKRIKKSQFKYVREKLQQKSLLKIGLSFAKQVELEGEPKKKDKQVELEGESKKKDKQVEPEEESDKKDEAGRG